MQFLPSYSSLSSSFHSAVRGSLTTAAQRGRRRRDGQVFEPRQLYLEDPRPAPPTPRAGRLLWLLLFNIEPEPEIPLLCFALVFLHLATHTRSVVLHATTILDLSFCVLDSCFAALSPPLSPLPSLSCFVLLFNAQSSVFFSGHSLWPWG